MSKVPIQKGKIEQNQKSYKFDTHAEKAKDQAKENAMLRSNQKMEYVSPRKK